MVDTPVTQIDLCVTYYRSMETAAVDKLGLGHVGIIVSMSFVDTCILSVQIDGTAIFTVILKGLTVKSE